MISGFSVNQVYLAIGCTEYGKRFLAIGNFKGG